jgi:hypothetical protein
MERAYYDPADPVAYGGVNALAAKFGNRKKAERFVQTSKTYRKFKVPRLRNINKARLEVESIGQFFQSDLFDMSKFARANKGHHFIILVVDCMSRFLSALPLKRKSAQYVAEAFTEIFETLNRENRLAIHVRLGTDRGTEYRNKDVEQVFKQFNVIRFDLINPPNKAFLAENSGRHLLSRIYQYMHANDTKTWIDKLPDFVKAKNNRLNVKFGFRPSEVNFTNQKRIRESIVENSKLNKKESKPLEVGQRVHMMPPVMNFHKSFSGYFSEKVYKISVRHKYQPGVYRYLLVDEEDGAEVIGSWYREELQPL